MIGRQDCSLAKNRTSFELFRDGRWQKDISYDDLCLEMKQELACAFGSTRMSMSADEEVEVRVPPPPPFQQDAFVKKIAECTVKYLLARQQSPLDHDMWNKILFADNYMYDFALGVQRKQIAADRLYNHTKRPFQEFVAPEELKEAIAEFSKMLC